MWRITRVLFSFSHNYKYKYYKEIAKHLNIKVSMSRVRYQSSIKRFRFKDMCPALSMDSRRSKIKLSCFNLKKMKKSRTMNQVNQVRTVNLHLNSTSLPNTHNKKYLSKRPSPYLRPYPSISASFACPPPTPVPFSAYPQSAKTSTQNTVSTCSKRKAKKATKPSELVTESTRMIKKLSTIML